MKDDLRLRNDDKPWQIVGRRTIYSSDWINLHLLELGLPDGQVLHDVHLLDYPHEAAAVVPVGDDGKILLIDHYRFQTDTRGWEIPAGRIDDGESASEAIARELQEETGHRAHTYEYIGHYFPSNGSSNQRFHLYAARGIERIGDIEDRNEVMGIR